MPRFDKTGPGGMGPRTGWGRGPCGDGIAQIGRGRGFGRGFGWRGCCPFWQNPYQNLTKKEELGMLEDEEKGIGEELKALKEEIAKLKGKK